MTDPGHVYFLAWRDLVKIGWSRDPVARAVALGAASSGTIVPAGFDQDDAVLLGTVPGSARTERLLHATFAAYRVVGEWFLVDGDLRTLVASLDHVTGRHPADRPIPAPREIRQHLAFRERTSVMAQVDAVAASLGTTRSAAVRHLVELGMRDHPLTGA